MQIEKKDGYIFIGRKHQFNGKTHEAKIGHFPCTLLHSEIPQSILNNITVIESAELSGYMADHTAKRLYEDLVTGVQIAVKSLKDPSFFQMNNEEIQGIYDALDGARKRVAKLYKKQVAPLHPKVGDNAA
jgi:hypothetical protein